MPARRTQRPMWVRRGAISLVFAVAMLVLYVAAVRTGAGQALDARSLGAFGWVGPAIRDVLAWSRYLVPEVCVLLAVVLGVTALIRRRWRDASQTTLLAAVTVLVAGPLRDVVLIRPYLGDHAYLQNSYPSRHVVVMLVLSIIVVRFWPWRGAHRWVARILLAATVIVAAASVSTLAHRMSDLIGAVLFVGIIAPWFDAGHGRGIPRVLAPSAAVVAALVWACGLLLATASGPIVSAVGFTVVFITGVVVPALAVLRLSAPT